MTIKDDVEIIETQDFEYIFELLEQYPKTPTHVDKMKSWVYNNAIYKYIVVYQNKKSGAIWITKFDNYGNTFYNFECYRDKRISAKNAFIAYKAAAEKVLTMVKVPRILMDCKPDERYAILLARSLGFKHFQTTDDGLLLFGKELINA